jgi:hypothetical protein
MKNIKNLNNQNHNKNINIKKAMNKIIYEFK